MTEYETAYNCICPMCGEVFSSADGPECSCFAPDPLTKINISINYCDAVKAISTLYRAGKGKDRNILILIAELLEGAIGGNK